MLFEKKGRHAGQIVGRSPYLQPVHVIGSDTLVGTIASVTITRTEANSLFGKLAHGRADHRGHDAVLASAGA